MDIAGERSGTWESRADAVDAGDATAAAARAAEVPCVKLVKCGISIGDKMPGSDAGVSKELADPGCVCFSAFESPNEQRERDSQGFVQKTGALSSADAKLCLLASWVREDVSEASCLKNGPLSVLAPP